MSENSEYIGKGHPPKKHQFKPGQTGNPNGRPKGRKNIKTVVKEFLSGVDKEGEWASPLVKGLIEIAFSKDENDKYRYSANERRRAIETLMDRVEGKPTQKVHSKNETTHKTPFSDLTDAELERMYRNILDREKSNGEV